MTLSVEFKLDNLPCLDPRALAQWFQNHGKSLDHWWGKPNCFKLPRGMSPGRGWVLLTRADVLALNLNSTSHVLTIKCGDNSIAIQNLTILSAHALDAGNPNTADLEAAYLVELVDRRHFGKFSSVNRQYNVSSAEGSAFKETEVGSFGEIIADLWEDLGFLGPMPKLPHSNSSPKNYRFPGVSAYDALGKILSDLDWELIVHPSGQVSIHDAAELDAQAQAELVAARFSDNIEDTTRTIEPLSLVNIPETISVHFHARFFSFQKGRDDQPTAEDIWQSRCVHAIHISSRKAAPRLPNNIILNTLPGTSITVWESEEATYKTNGELANPDQLQKLAEYAATSYIQAVACSDSRLNEIYTGVMPFRSSGNIAGIAWYDLGQGVQTEIVLAPRGTDLTGKAPTCLPDVLTSIAYESNNPPDVARHHTPYARRCMVETLAPLKPCSSVLCRVYFFDDEWKKSQCTLNATDIFGLTRDPGTRCWVAWSWQHLGWVIVATVPTTPIANLCVDPDKFEEVPAGETVQATLLIPDKRSYLRIRKEKQTPVVVDPDVSPNPAEKSKAVAIDIVAEDSHVVLCHKDGGKNNPVQFRSDPSVGMLSVGYGQRGVVEWKDKGFELYAGGEWKCQWPATVATRVGDRLIAHAISPDGGSVILGWDRKICGVTGYFCAHAYDTGTGSCTTDPITLYVEDGRIIWTDDTTAFSNPSSPSAPYSGCYTGSTGEALTYTKRKPTDPCGNTDPKDTMPDSGEDEAGAQGGAPQADEGEFALAITQKYSAAKAKTQARYDARRANIQKQLSKAKSQTARDFLNRRLDRINQLEANAVRRINNLQQSAIKQHSLATAARRAAVARGERRAAERAAGAAKAAKAKADREAARQDFLKRQAKTDADTAKVIQQKQKDAAWQINNSVGKSEDLALQSIQSTFKFVATGKEKIIFYKPGKTPALASPNFLGGESGTERFVILPGGVQQFLPPE